MPVVYVYAYERSPEKKRQLVKEVTDALCRSYEVSPEIVTVYLFDVDKGNAGHAGILASDEDGASA